MEDVVADSQVVLQTERLQHHAVPDGEGEPQLLVGVRWTGQKQTTRVGLAICTPVAVGVAHCRWV